MKKVLITGASGLLGKAVLRHLINTKKYDVFAVTTNVKHLEHFAGITIIECDLTRENERQELMEKVQPDIFVHLAWNQAVENFRMSDTNLLWLNISTHLLYLFEQFNGTRFIFAGSSSEYDGATGVFDESVDVVPASLYGLSKKTFNLFAENYCKVRHIEYVGMRLFTIYGSEDEHSFGAIPSALCKLSRGEKLVCNSPETTRDYIYVEDAASVVEQLLEHTFCGIVNVASGQARTMREVFQYIGNAMNKSECVVMNENPSESKRFEADIQLLKSLHMEGIYGEFEKNINKVIQEYKRK